MNNMEKIGNLNSWKVKSDVDWLPDYQFVVGKKTSYHINCESWDNSQNILDAIGSLCIVNRYDNGGKDGGPVTEREWLKEDAPIKELLIIAENHYNKNYKE